MSEVEHLQELHGLPAFDFPGPDHQGELPAAASVAWRIASLIWDDDAEPFEALFDRFLATVDTSAVRALIIGPWGEPYDNDSGPVVDRLVAARDRLTALEAVFIGDLEMEEAEISWIEQSDVTPVLTAYPALREFGVRGSSGLRFPAVRHEHLRTLSFETGGLPADVVRGVGASDLPALEYLEMWLGVDEYGGDYRVEDLAPLLAGDRLPNLRHLGLQNSDLQDAIAAAVAAAPVVARLESLDLSMGVLTDEGALALLEGQSLAHLKWLDLHHNYIGEEMGQRLRDALEPSGVELDLSDDDADEYEWEDGRIMRYTAVAE
ncbi:STM4015 family protein [Streptomyces sp. NPDC050617]|uniref:STM4015 family protein n=1 Tax=Streptomyces sp. NPDC050617 TaxID=3154628 RepID=UPI003441E188